MRYIGPVDEERIRARFGEQLEHDVRLVLFVQPPTGLYIPGREEPQTGRQAQQLMEEVAALSDKLRLEVHNPRLAPELAAQYRVERTPALVIERAGSSGGPGTGKEPDAPAAGNGVSAGDAAGDPAGDPAADSAAASAGEPAGAADEADNGADNGAAARSGLVRFFGLPSGYEFATLLEDVVDVSRGQTRLSEATRAAVAAIAAPVHLQVFVTPT